MKTLSIVIALILTLGVAAGASAATFSSSSQQQSSSSSEGKKDFYKGWIELNSGH
jgi:hypothetical protein